jgi:hypothetical protein
VGHSPSQHLVWNPTCKACFEHHLECSNPANPHLCSSSLGNVCQGLYLDIGMSYVMNGAIDCDADSYPDETLVNGNNSDYIGDQVSSAELNLQKVIAFPVAFTNTALHEVELLKLLHKN